VRGPAAATSAPEPPPRTPAAQAAYLLSCKLVSPSMITQYANWYHPV
jgi:hypothetical protein